MSIESTGLGDDVLVVSPKGAARMLSLGVTKIYELISDRQLESYRDGAARKITTRSVKAYVERRLDQSRAV
jgi:excisionase family DNA binding protein